MSNSSEICMHDPKKRANATAFQTKAGPQEVQVEYGAFLNNPLTPRTLSPLPPGSLINRLNSKKPTSLKVHLQLASVPTPMGLKR